MVKMKSRNELARNIRFIAMGFMVLFAVTAMRAYFLQVLKSGELTGIIQNQYMTSVELMPYRGTVYDRNGAELAASLDVESLYARPALVRDPKAAAKLLAPILELPAKAVYRDLASPKPFVWLQRKVTPTQADKIQGTEDRRRRISEGKPAVLSAEGTCGTGARVCRSRLAGT